MVGLCGVDGVSKTLKFLLFSLVLVARRAVQGVKVEKIHGQATLECGNAEKWYNPYGMQIHNESSKYLIMGSNLTIFKIIESDLGTYFCEVAGSNSSLSLHSPPFVKPLEKSVNVVQGNEIKVECHAWGSPTPQFTWYRVENDVNIYLSNTSKLYVNESKKEDYGIYMCVATNEHGNASSTTKIRVKDKLAPLWPFIGILIEVIILVVIIIIYEKRKSKQDSEENAKENMQKPIENNASGVRQRK